MKNNVLIRVAAAMVALCYCLSIIGFDVHTCNTSGRTFIVSFLQEMSCEAIHSHSSDDCHACCCGGSAGEDSEPDLVIGSPDCCTDDYQMLTTSADMARQSGRISFLQAPVVVMPWCSCPVSHSLHENFSYIVSGAGSGPFAQCDARIAGGVWRI